LHDVVLVAGRQLNSVAPAVGGEASGDGEVIGDAVDGDGAAAGREGVHLVDGDRAESFGAGDVVEAGDGAAPVVRVGGVA
jgi:hypothetical protein